MEAGMMKSLSEICQEQLKRKYLGKVETLQLIDIARELDLPDLRSEALNAFRFSYDFFHDIVEYDYLCELCGEEEIAKLELARTERHKSRRYLRQEGAVLERRSTAYSEASVALANEAFEEQPSQFFPYEALVAGVKWPNSVDPARREAYLSEEDFEKLFKMSRAEFAALTKFKRDRKKKELSLW